MRKIQLYKNTGRGIYIGAIDAITKAYIRKNEVFADAFNYFMYDGEQKIRPEQLRELDTTEIAILLNEKDTKDNKNTKDRKNGRTQEHSTIPDSTGKIGGYSFGK